jgi:hypothetical protein
MFKCQECGSKFRTARAAERAANRGCPKCGGVDIDLSVDAPDHTPEGLQLKCLMGEWYALDADGQPFKCAPTKELALEYARQGRRPDERVSF